MRGQITLVLIAVIVILIAFFMAMSNQGFVHGFSIPERSYKSCLKNSAETALENIEPSKDALDIESVEKILADYVNEDIMKCEMLANYKKSSPKTTVEITDQTVVFKIAWLVTKSNGNSQTTLTNAFVEIPLRLKLILEAAETVFKKDYDADLTLLDYPLNIYFFMKNGKKYAVFQDPEYRQGYNFYITPQ